VSKRAAILMSCVLTVILCMALIASCKGSTLTEAEVEDEIFRLVNEARVMAGVPLLERDSNLDRLAQLHSANELSDDVVQNTELRYLMRNSWWVVYSRGSPRLTEDTARNQVNYCLESEKLREVMLRSEARKTGIGMAVVGKTVYYTQVFDVLNAASGSGAPIRLYENPQASDTTWSQLVSFLFADDTDKQPYIPDLFVCSDFAALLHNKAEAMGIKAAYVSVDFIDGPSHAINAFNTTDRGLVFIDSTGPGFVETASGDSSPASVEYDKVAYIDVGYEYGMIPLDKATAFDYAFYEQWVQQWDTYEQKVALYNSGSLPYSQLVKLKNDIEELKRILGDYHWEPLGIVTNVYIHW
jgi:hypothetical protein